MATSESSPWRTENPPEADETFSIREYLEWVKHDPNLSETAHQRIWRMVMAKGLRDPKGHPYPFFSETLFGIDQAIESVVDEYFRPAAMGFDVRRRILLLVGPVGGGKSTLVNLIKRGLESFTGTTGGAVYALVGCPMHEDPMHLLSMEERERLADGHGARAHWLEGELCPACQWRLDHEYQGNRDGFTVKRVRFSEARRVGIGTYAPSDPRSQDISELTGSVDFAQIGIVGSESDPRAFRFDGELNIANRGLVEFQEMLKLDERFLYHLLSLSQEGNFKTGRYQLISADEVIVGHTNENEFRVFKKNPKNQALLSRMVVVPVPYNLDVDQEVKIYQKLLLGRTKPGQHVAPKALEMAATVAVLSRLEDEETKESDRLSKLERLRGHGRESSGSGEGFEGMDPRFVINRLSQLLARSEACVDGLDAIRALLTGVLDDPFVDAKWRETVQECALVAETLCYQEIESEVRRAFVAEGEEQIQALYQNYVEALTHSVEEPATFAHSREERFLRAIETRLDVAESQKHQFREEIYLGLKNAQDDGYGSRATKLSRALEEKLFDDLRDAMHLSAPDRAMLGWIEHAVEHMVASGGYCPRCATGAIRRLGTVFRR